MIWTEHPISYELFLWAKKGTPCALHPGDGWCGGWTTPLYVPSKTSHQDLHMRGQNKSEFTRSWVFSRSKIGNFFGKFQEGHEKYFLGHPLNFRILKKYYYKKKLEMPHAFSDLVLQAKKIIPRSKNRLKSRWQCACAEAFSNWRDLFLFSGRNRVLPDLQVAGHYRATQDGRGINLWPSPSKSS